MQLLHVLDDVLATRGSEDGMELCLKQASSSSPQKNGYLEKEVAAPKYTNKALSSSSAGAASNDEDCDRPKKDQEFISFHRDVVAKDSDKGIELVFLEPPPQIPDNWSAQKDQLDNHQMKITPVVVDVDPYHLVSTLPSKCSRGHNIANNMNAKQSMHSLTKTAAKPPKTLGFMAKKRDQNQDLSATESRTDKSIANKNTMRRSWPRLGRGRKYATTKTLVQKPLHHHHHHAVDDDLLDVRDDHESSRVVKKDTAPTSTTLLLESLSKDVSKLMVMLYQLQQQNKRREQASSDTDSTDSKSSSCADDDRNFIIIDPEEENEMRDDGCSIIAGFLELLAGDDDEANKCYQENAKRLFSI
ncbi:hypothetical protein ACHAWU_006720 [Discostella pseudostelligera]|uniref:Uncharacterized protein n=1 Tax=Discostella pseudostelligera TaxID=259834 RepID=A0ABD3MAH0_9STRA